jgi:hypothetical protein
MSGIQAEASRSPEVQRSRNFLFSDAEQQQTLVVVLLSVTLHFVHPLF